MDKLIRHIRNIIPLTDEQADIFMQHIREQQFSKKEHLLLSKERAKEVFFVISGCTRTYIYDFNGVEHNLSFAIEDWWFGDLQSFINNTPANYNIQALEDTTVLSIDRASWNTLLEQIPEFVVYTRALFRNTMFSQENRILQNLSFTAEERYHNFLTSYPDLAKRISQKHMASYLGITPEFLSMIRSKIKN